MTEKDPIIAGAMGGEAVERDPIYEEKHKTRLMKVVIGVFLGVVAFFIAITIIMTSIQSWRVTPLYTLLLINLLAIGQVLVFLVLFIYTGRLAKTCVWAIFVVGVVVIAESISTDILVFTIEDTSK